MRGELTHPYALPINFHIIESEEYENSPQNKAAELLQPDLYYWKPSGPTERILLVLTFS